MTRPVVVGGVTFDFWNTLISEGGFSDHRVERWHEVLLEGGHDVTDESLRDVTGRLWTWFTERWEANEQVTPHDAAVRTVELLAVPRDPELVDALVAVSEAGYDPAQMIPAPGIGDALESLRTAGVRVGIICDVGLTPSRRLRSYLEHHGLLGHFDHWSFSDEVGTYKPDPAIFAHARTGLGLADDAPMAHVGDLRRTDVAGARGVGWTSVRYTGLHDDTVDLPEADLVVSHHDDLAAHLGIGT